MRETMFGLLLTAMTLAIIGIGLWMVRYATEAREEALGPATKEEHRRNAPQVIVPPVPASTPITPERPAPFFQQRDMEQIHTLHAERFAKAAGFGPTRMIDIEDFPNIPRDGKTPIPGTWPELQRIGDWKVIRTDLVGRVDGNAPVVYRSAKRAANKMANVMTLKERERIKASGMREVDPSWTKEFPNRETTAWEVESLAALKKGRGVVWRMAGNAGGVAMMGALRAEGRCLKCHEDAEGTLLGALVYEVEWSPQSANLRQRAAKN